MSKHDPRQFPIEAGFSFSAQVSSPDVSGPNTVSQTITQPAIKIFQLALYTCHTEVIEPALSGLIELLDTFIEGTWSSLPCDDFEFLLERFPAFIAYHQLVFPTFTLHIGGDESVSQYREVYRFAYSAFLPVDR